MLYIFLIQTVLFVRDMAYMIMRLYMQIMRFIICIFWYNLCVCMDRIVIVKLVKLYNLYELPN